MRLLRAQLAIVLLGLALAFGPARAHEGRTRFTSESLPVVSAQRDFGQYGEVWRVPMRKREIALTFDDGPYPFYTPLLLHVLDRSRVPATFFIVGRSAQEFPELVDRIVASGDEIGNHTFNHYTLTQLNEGQIASQITLDGEFLEPF